jgi:hypothetical protein
MELDGDTLTGKIPGPASSGLYWYEFRFSPIPKGSDE